MPKIALDAMGSDHHPDPEIQAAVEAAHIFKEEIYLVGPEDILKPKLEATDGKNIRVVHAPEVYTMNEKLSGDMLREAKTSLAVGMQLVKTNQADAFVTAGNTGGAMANALYQLRRIRGVKRPALCAPFPVKNGHCIVLDIGANAECRAEYLLQFGLMGAIYAKTRLQMDNPRVGLLSNGEEAGKGNDLVKEAFPLLEASMLNFIGNVEGKELFEGEADVVVTDGFTGNVLMKSSEAVAKLLTDILREEMTSNLRTTIGALLAKPAFNRVKKMLDPAEIGAVPLLGINGLVFVGHGRSDGRALVSAIAQARQAVDVELLNSIRNTIKRDLKSAQA